MACLGDKVKHRDWLPTCHNSSSSKALIEGSSLLPPWILLCFVCSLAEESVVFSQQELAARTRKRLLAAALHGSAYVLPTMHASRDQGGPEPLHESQEQEELQIRY